jgi:hypothetical protein
MYMSIKSTVFVPYGVCIELRVKLVKGKSLS